jgi:hypothetical protein
MHDGSDVVVVHDEGIDVIGARDGELTRRGALGAQYRSCPAPHEGILAAPPGRRNVAVSKGTLVLSLEGCDAGIWTRDLESGIARLIAPATPDGEWTGQAFGGLPLTARGGRAFACILRFPTHQTTSVELWSFDLASGRRERLSVLPAGHSCDELIADDAAIYMASRTSFPDVSLLRFELGTGALAGVASATSIITQLTQDDTAIYFTTWDEHVFQIDKKTFTATPLAFPFWSQGSLGARDGVLYASGGFLRPGGRPHDGVWAAPAKGEPRPLTSFERSSPAWTPEYAAGLAVSDTFAFVPIRHEIESPDGRKATAHAIARVSR